MITNYEVSLADGVIRATTDAGALCGFHPIHSGCNEEAFRVLASAHVGQGEFVCLAGELRSLPTKPTDSHFWSWAAGDWMVGIDDLRRLRRDEVNEWRNSMEFAPFAWAGMVFDADADSQRRLQLAALSAQQAVMTGTMPEPTIDWTLEDNTTVTLTATQLLAAARAMGDHINLAHQSARALKAQIESATSVEQLMAIMIG